VIKADGLGAYFAFNLSSGIALCPKNRLIKTTIKAIAIKRVFINFFRSLMGVKN